MFETNPENAPIIEKMAAMLSELPVGSTLPYEALSSAVGRDVVGTNRHLLNAAREQVEKNLGCVLECVRGVGVKRLNPSDAPEVGLTAMQRVRRLAKRGRKRLDRLNSNSLTEFDQRRVIAYRAMLGAISTIADGRKAGAIASVADPVKPIPPENILQMFSVKKA